MLFLHVHRWSIVTQNITRETDARSACVYICRKVIKQLTSFQLLFSVAPLHLRQTVLAGWYGRCVDRCAGAAAERRDARLAGALLGRGLYGRVAEGASRGPTTHHLAAVVPRRRRPLPPPAAPDRRRQRRHGRKAATGCGGLQRPRQRPAGGTRTAHHGQAERRPSGPSTCHRCRNPTAASSRREDRRRYGQAATDGNAGGTVHFSTDKQRCQATGHATSAVRTICPCQQRQSAAHTCEHPSQFTQSS